MSTIYYLNWDVEGEDTGPATELFHELHGEEPPLQMKQDDFDRMYRKIREIPYDIDGPEPLWRQWNRGSGYESREFLSTRYCDDCRDSFESMDDAYHHFYHQHYGPDTELEEFFDYIHGVRSMSVGDIVEIDDIHYIAGSIGWGQIDLIEGDTGST